MEIMETMLSVLPSNAVNPMIFRECRVFRQNAIVLRFYKNILFLISISWSLLCEFNTKIFTFPLPLLPKSVCFVTYWLNMWPWRQNFTYENLALHVMMVVKARCWVL